MEYIVCCMFDEKSGLFGNLLSFNSIPEAKRYFSFACHNDSNALYCKDLRFYKVGSFNVCSGVFNALALPELIMSYSDTLSNE